MEGKKLVTEFCVMSFDERVSEKIMKRNKEKPKRNLKAWGKNRKEMKKKKKNELQEKVIKTERGEST